MKSSSQFPTEDASPKTSELEILRALVMVAGISGFLIVLVYKITLPMIEENKRLAINRALYQIFPEAVIRRDFVISGQRLVSIDTDQIAKNNTIYAVYNNQNQLEGVALEAATQGYQDIIRILYGYDPACQCIRGFVVLKMAETPGVGDKITKDPQFLQNFKHLDAGLNDDASGLTHDIVTVKHHNKINPWEINAITGATISSGAVGRMLNESAQQMLPLISTHLEQLQNFKKVVQ